MNSLFRGFSLVLLLLFISNTLANTNSKMDLLINKAQGGDAEAQYDVSEYYYYGWDDFQKDEIESVKWLKKAAEQGHPDAQYHLAECYYSGKRGIEKNEEEYLKWINRSAEGGNASAYFSLGLYYKEKDKQQAIVYLNNCRNTHYYEYGKENENAINALAELGVKVTPQKERTRGEVLLNKAKCGDREAQYDVSKYYYYGLQNFQKDEKESVKWLKKAAEQGHPDAQYDLAECYYRGERGIEKNEEEYLKWITRSAEGGKGSAYFSLGLYYKDKDKQQAIKWFKKDVDESYLSTGETDEYASEQLRKLGVEYNPEDKNTTYTDNYTAEESFVGDILVKTTYETECLLANINYQEGEYKKAIKAYSEIIDQYDNLFDCSEAYLGRALALLMQEKYEEANKDLIYLQNNSNTPDDIKETSSKLLLKSQQILAVKNKPKEDKTTQWIESLSSMFNAINMGIQGANTGMQGAPTYNYQNSTSRPTIGTKKVTCSYCKGKGWVAGSRTATYGLNNSYWCNECNEEVNASHSHDRCPSCNGTGYNSKITYE